VKLWPALAFIGCLIFDAYAAVGQVTEQLNAPPNITRQNKNLPGPKGTGVEMQDAIKTGQGKVGITFEDDTRVQITENSKLVIDDFVYDPKSKSGNKLAVKMAMGTIRYASGQIAKNSPQSVAVTTPSATIGVRGTDFTATIEELGESTIILLPSCPRDKPHRNVKDIESNCVTGTIIVESDAGTVILNQPFQATRVTSRAAVPMKPVTLSLSEDAISNLLILSPPKEIAEANKTEIKMRNALDRDFFAFNGLDNALEMQMNLFNQDRLASQFLEQDYLINIFSILDGQNGLNEDFLKEVDTVLPDYKRSSGIVAFKDDLIVELCRDDGSNIQCVTTPKNQNSTIYQTQRNLEFKNRVNQGGNTIITLIQR
jgi:hypothetical protein